MTVLACIQAAGPLGQTVSEIHAAFRAVDHWPLPSRDHIAETVGWHAANDRIVALAMRRGNEVVYVSRAASEPHIEEADHDD